MPNYKFVYILCSNIILLNPFRKLNLPIVPNLSLCFFEVFPKVFFIVKIRKSGVSLILFKKFGKTFVGF